MHNDIIHNMDNKKLTLLVLIDLSAAFDTVDHNILLDVLIKRFGIQGTTYDWFKSFLFDRQLKVLINNTSSTLQTLNCGVPQGSCVGPILYSIYASTITEIIKKHLPECMGYADDHALYLSFSCNDPSSKLRAITNMQNCLSDIKL